MPHEDAMSAACQARNVPALQWILMGENWHNNHHAAPTSASAWVEWYQVDGVYILIRCLELVGLAYAPPLSHTLPAHLPHCAARALAS